MSSKLVRGGAVEAQPMVWRPVGSPVPGLQAPMQEREPSQQFELEQRLASVQQEAEQRVRAAFQQGLQQGDANARQELGTRLDGTVERLARSIQDIAGVRQRCRREGEQDLVKLALAIARRILHRELTVDSDAILGLVKAALDKLDAREVQSIRVHPENADALNRYLDRMGLPQRLQITPDPSLERGAAIFETSRGSLDASAETQLAEIERGFTDLVRHAS